MALTDNTNTFNGK